MVENASFVCQVWGGVRRALWGSVLLIFLGFLFLALSILAMHDNLNAFDGLATDSSKGKVEYYLPYPGLLPDSPLYKIKAARDIIFLWLTMDKTQKGIKQMTYADKRIGAAKYLLEGGKTALAVTTASKAEKYLEKSFIEFEKLSKEGKDVKSNLINLQKASEKHQEILEEILAKTTDSERNMATETLKMNKLLQQRINQIWLEVK